MKGINFAGRIAAIAGIVLTAVGCEARDGESASTSSTAGGAVSPASATEAPDVDALAPSLGSGAAIVASNSGGDATLVKVYKDPNCGCCVKWMEHLEKNGFKVESMDMPDLSLLKQKHGVTGELQSCHTAIIGDYVIEGHVPAEVIRKLLKEKPAVLGLAVPGMPMGSPGMEGATRERYDILTFDRAGRTKVYAQR
ncbi:MAG: DUF411 domain-containing protein [Gemmatimonadaceae bacterium]|nr:DUF411 domain-containing protein [Gemmatimonadaceae bacterium]